MQLGLEINPTNPPELQVIAQRSGLIILRKHRGASKTRLKVNKLVLLQIPISIYYYYYVK